MITDKAIQRLYYKLEFSYYKTWHTLTEKDKYLMFGSWGFQYFITGIRFYLCKKEILKVLKPFFNYVVMFGNMR